ncbi:MAG: CCA tRNA nucleotidyltransferase [Candidatus Sericytochromatia bacterium]|nr:CCA tRNA nucleotidyltransferase [Candidatus Sericytochromatia bacterium]
MQLLRLMQNYFPPPVLDLLQQTGQAAADLNLKVYLIGGSIRDLLLPHRAFDWDIDLVVENQGEEARAEALARELQSRLGGQLQVFKQYGTAKLGKFKPDERLQLDIATARTESYAYPGANPEVAFSDLHADLDRRDFSVNALAIALLPDNFGQLIDYFEGYHDLQHRHLRTLHPDKFREDPVRAWRACRLEQALDFQIESETAELIADTMKSGLFDGFCSARIRVELRKVLSFDDPIPCLLRLSELGVLRCLDPHLKLNETLLDALNRLEQWQPWFAEAHDAWAAPLCLLLEAVPLEKRPALLPKLELNQHQLRSWLAFEQKSQTYLQNDWSKMPPSAIYAALKAIPDLTLWLWLARYPESPLALTIERYWLEWRNLKPFLTGHELKQWLKPGPHMRALLNELLRARLDGETHSHDDEMTLAQKLIQQRQEVL